MKDEELKFEIDAPWGQFHSDSGFLGLLDHVISQLTGFLEQGISPDPELTELDLRGYKMIREHNNEEKAQLFFLTKWIAQDEKRPFPNNVAIVEHLVKAGRL